MTRDELAETIVEPAAKTGLSFEAGSAETILDDLGEEPGACRFWNSCWRGYGRSGAVSC